MSTRAGLNALARGVRAYLALPWVNVSVPVVVSFGKGRYRQDNRNDNGRVVLMPGEVDPATGDPRPSPAGRVDRAAEQNVTIPGPQLAGTVALTYGDRAIAFSQPQTFDGTVPLLFQVPPQSPNVEAYAKAVSNSTAGTLLEPYRGPSSTLANVYLGTQIVRALGWWHYRFTATVWAIDADEPQNEELQIERTEALFESVHQAIVQATDPDTGLVAGFANVEEFGDPAWVSPPAEQAFGRELWTYYTLLVPLLEIPAGLAFPAPVVNRGES